MKINNSKILLITQSTNILLGIDSEKGYHSKLNIALGCTYYHMSVVLKRLKSAELIRMERKGRNRIVEITEKGKIISDNLKKIVELIE